VLAGDQGLRRGAWGGTIVARFNDVESGHCPDRPESACGPRPGLGDGSGSGGRQARPAVEDAAFLLSLRDSGVRFAAVDLPEANDLSVGIMALVIQQEREATSRRRGVRLGNPNGGEALKRVGKDTATSWAASAVSLREIATELTAHGILTRRGERWRVSTLMNLLDRLGEGRYRRHG
jgi:hypothetical protein